MTDHNPPAAHRLSCGGTAGDHQHHPDGSPRTIPPTARGRALDRFIPCAGVHPDPVGPGGLVDPGSLPCPVRAGTEPGGGRTSCGHAA